MSAAPSPDQLRALIQEYAFRYDGPGLDGKGRWYRCHFCKHGHLDGGTFPAGARHRVGAGCFIERLEALLPPVGAPRTPTCVACRNGDHQQCLGGLCQCIHDVEAPRTGEDEKERQ